MKHRNFAGPVTALAGAIALALCSVASAQLVVSDDFTQAHDTNDWMTFNGACLTAGDGTGTIPPCVGLPYYQGQTLWGGNSGQLPDPAGSGALRFTNGNNSGGGFANGYNQAGSIISNFTFPTYSGIQITFKTVTYRGNSGGAGRDGADGMSFFLMDGSLSPYDTGAFGGSLGYTCSNRNNDSTTRADGTTRGYDGLRGGYLGLGIDEYGNFLNGVTDTLGEGATASGDNTASGGGYQPGRIGLRGAGSISWAGLNVLSPSNYPSSLTTSQQAQAVKNTCRTGTIWNYSNPGNPSDTGTAVPDYNAIPGGYKVLSGVTIANEAAMKRGDAQPITYNLRITQDGLLSLSYSYNGGAYQPVISKQSITASNGALPASFRFGFAGSTGGSTNIHEILCFQAQPSDLAATSIGVNEKQATKIATGTQAFLAFYYPNDWTGRLTASNLLYDPVAQTITISNTANWDAQCNLTGVASGDTCDSTGVTGPVAAQGPTARTMMTWSGSAGIPFQFASLPTAMQNLIDAGDATPFNNQRVSYLRGSRTREITSSGSGQFRARDGVLADIIDSSPTWVGPPTSPYTAVWTDLLHTGSAPENSATQSYTQYLATAQTRLNVVYAGANDGFLHGFRSGAFDSSGNYVNNSTTPNDGSEVLAYMPGLVVGTIHNSTDSTLDYSSTQYAHNFYVDATPGADDLFYQGAWHTWLFGGLGPGGAAVYALDVTDPTQFSEANASTVVVGEWSATNLTCSNVSNCANNLGNTYGVPVIRRLHNGKWAAIFGNGYGSSSGDAGIFVMTVDPTTAAKTFYYLSTSKSGTNDGISFVAPADLDGDHITDYVYAGDLLGNVWRFDLTSTNPAAWAVSSTTPLFTVPGNQPITTKLLLAIVPQTGGAPRLMVDFGTGRKFPVTTTASAQYATGSQSLYGIWDWNMASWNSQASASSQFSSLAAPQSISLSNLQAQTITASSTVTGVRDVSTSPVCWAGSTTCGSGNTQFGWTVALPGTNEQVIFSPILYQNAFLVNTTIPANNSPTTCTAATDTGYTMAVNVLTGASLPNFFKVFNDTNAGGAQTNGVGSPFVVTAGGMPFVLTQTLGSGLTPLCPPNSPTCSFQTSAVGPTGKRLTWIQRR